MSEASADRSSERGAGEGITRRGLVSGAALLGANAGVARILGGSASGSPKQARPTDATTEPFYGPHQAGVATAAQDFLCFAAFDLTVGALSELRALLEQWSTVAAQLTAGRPFGGEPQPPHEAPLDTGEALGRGPSRLTLTFGFGPGLFASRMGHGGLGLEHLRPAELRPLPPFRGERLDPRSSGGDLCVQACADDPQVAFHAVHVLSRVATGAALLRWSQQGFGRTSSTSRAQRTPRNLMGFKDGTDNLRAEDALALEEFLWVNPGEQPRWMAGGTYLITRRIRMLFDAWDGTHLEAQQRTIGREKLSGAPLGARSEHDPVNLHAINGQGELVIPPDAHIRLASPDNNHGQPILRRGYSYGEGAGPGAGEIDAGLFFIAFQRSPQRQFIPLQRQLAASDALNRFTVHTSSAIFACPPGALPGGFVGDVLFS